MVTRKKENNPHQEQEIKRVDAKLPDVPLGETLVEFRLAI